MNYQSIRLFLTRKSRARTLVFAGGGLLILGLAWLMFSGNGNKGAKGNTTFYTVKRGNFTVSIVEGGSLRAVNEVIIRSEVEGQPRIIKIVAEGTMVNKGDLLVELDSAELRDRQTQQTLQVENSQFAYDQSQQDLAIQRSIFESNVKDAELRRDFAKSDLEKFEEGDIPQQLRDATNAIVLAEVKLKQAQDRLDWTVKLEKKGYATKTELESDDLAVKQADITMESAKEKFRIMTKYDHPKDLKKLQANMENADKELERVRQRGEASVSQYEATVTSRKRTLDLQNDKLDEIKQQIELTMVKAPQDGLVVYPFSERYGGSSSMIEEGATIRQRQEIIKLPDTSQMLVEIKVHESYVNQIAAGLPAFVKVDSLPDQQYQGVIRRVAPLPDTQSRYNNPNLKVYTTEVLITDELPNLKPGISARAEVVITNLVDVITVPLQAVSTIKGKQVVYVQSGQDSVPKPVEIGMYNDKFIEIKSGLKEGERVLLSPPSSNEDSNEDLDRQGSLKSTSKPSEKAKKELLHPVGGSIRSSGDVGSKPPKPSSSSDKKSSTDRPKTERKPKPERSSDGSSGGSGGGGGNAP